MNGQGRAIETELPVYPGQSTRDLYHSFDEMDAIIRSNAHAKKPSVVNAWKSIRPIGEKGVGYYTASKDAFVLIKLISDLGGLATKATIKVYNGKPHIILSGRSGLRKILTGTKYGLQNPKIVAMGLGKANVMSAARVGGLISIALLTTCRVVDLFLTDEQTLSHFFGYMATDIIKVGISVGLTLAALTVKAGAVFAVGLLVIAVVLGVSLSMTLDYLDQRYKISKKVVAGIEAFAESAHEKKNDFIADASAKGAEILKDAFDYTVKEAGTMAVDLAKSYIKRFASPNLANSV